MFSQNLQNKAAQKNNQNQQTLAQQSASQAGHGMMRQLQAWMGANPGAGTGLSLAAPGPIVAGGMPGSSPQVSQLGLGAPQTQMPTSPGGGPVASTGVGNIPIMTGTPISRPTTGFGPAPSPLGIPPYLRHLWGGGGMGGIKANGPVEQYNPA